LDCKIWDEHCGSDFDVLVLDSDFVELSSFQKSTCPIINITSDATLRNPSGIERHAIVVKPVLPNKLRDAIRTHVSAGSDETAEGQETRKRALVVDDIRLNRMLLIKNLAMKMKMKIDFDEAQNGVEALHLAMSSAHVYDIVLLYCNMPIMDGFETAQSLRELPRYKNIPIFAVTANDSIFDHAKCFSSGMDRVISKPVNFPVLVQEIRTAFEYPNERPFRMLCISDGDSSLDSRISVYNMALQPPLHEMSSIVNHSIQKDESMAISQIGTSLRPALRRNVSSIVAHPGLSQNMSNTTAHPGLRRNMSHIVAHPGLRRNMSKVVAHPGLGRNMSNIVAHPGPGRNMSNVGIPSGFGGNMAGHPASGRQLSGVTEQAGLHRKMPSGTCPARQLPSPPRESGVPERGFQDCMISGPEGRSRWPSLHS
jgi:CheY-like chemotaxis protein